MSTYADATNHMREALPEHVAKWVLRTFPCRCAADWTDRKMHVDYCEHVIAVDVLDAAHDDGLLAGGAS